MKTHRSTAWLALALACMVLSLPTQAARLALVIGNNAYSKVATLKNAQNDARLVAAVLRKAGFEVSEASNLNRTALWSTLDLFKGRIQKGDEVVFYFAGHGVQVGANQLLLPTDISAENDSQVQRDGVPLIDVQDALKDARLALLLIDACRDNPFPKTGTRTVGGTRGLTPPEASTGQIIMMSAGRNQKALDYVPDSAQANGLFAWELGQVLQTPGLEIRHALEDVKNRVDDKARRAGHEQRPSLVNDLRGPFVLFASLEVEPVKPAQRPAQGGGVSLGEYEKEESALTQWSQWQRGMKTDFDKIAGLRVSTASQAKAWGQFLLAWAQDNPYSNEDESLRAQAATRQAEAQRLSATPVAGSVLKDCDYCPELVVIPAGSFQMGSNDYEDEKPLHSVNIKSFALGKYEVTQGQWKAVMGGSNPSSFKDCGDTCPVETVSWDDIQKYIKELNSRSGQQYRLPSEAEWEYAARARTTSKYWWGDSASHEYANYGKDECCEGLAQGRDKWVNTAPAGQFPPNAFGLYDMHGNVWEWVQDYYHDNYQGGPTDGSAWESGGKKESRVLRGGSWLNSPSNLRSAIRIRDAPDIRFSRLGFRLARTLLTP
jgi:formylglycine-generating enzyme required for sulfatase activity